jgi:hypothetical protein
MILCINVNIMLFKYNVMILCIDVNIMLLK